MSVEMRGGATVHGGRLAEARREFPGAPEPFVDLSTGINPFPYRLPRLSDTCFTRLPEPEDVEALQATAAAAYDVRDPDMVVAAPGTQILIDLLPRLWCPRSVAVLGPTYGEYRVAWARVGCHVVEVSDFDALADHDVAVVCNPNNPDGRCLDARQLLALAGRMADKPDGLLIVDGAFADLETEPSVASALPHPALIVLRSFGKTFGLAGLRLSFALASPHRAATIRTALGPWAVSGPAIEIGRVALADSAWLTQARMQLWTLASALDDVLKEAGLRVRGGTCLFRLAETSDAASLFEKLGRAGILVRRFPDRRTWLRFGLPADPQSLERLREVLLYVRGGS